MKALLLTRILTAAAGAVLDLLFGDPQGLMHPVQGIGALIDLFERLYRALFRVKAGQKHAPGRERAAGLLTVLSVLAAVYGILRVLLFGAGKLHRYLPLLVEVVLAWQMLAMTSLIRAADQVRLPLIAGDVERARHAVSMIVGRDTEKLDAGGIAKAAVETVAENTSDGVIAPLFWLFLFGVPGMVLYKAVNTMDSMLGYRNDRYRFFGTAAARLDDLANYLPARLAALFMILAAYLLGYDGPGAVRIFLRDRYAHKSPNAAQTESVCAGALGLQLAGDAWYFGERHRKPFIGDPVRHIGAEDIRSACRLCAGTSALFFACGELLLFLCSLLF